MKYAKLGLIRKQSDRGFSYVELMFSVTILILLATAATPYLEKTIQRKKESELRESLRQIRTAIDDYKKASDIGKIAKSIDGSGYPNRLEDLVLGVPDITDPQKKKMHFLRSLPVDPMFTAEEPSSHYRPVDTWGKRAYKSDSENPREGDDVFDVYSLSDKKGLNGVPYQQW